ncbi:hypothetical protein MKW92_025264, partial [Papaver armeniacum]
FAPYMVLYAGKCFSSNILSIIDQKSMEDWVQLTNASYNIWISMHEFKVKIRGCEGAIAHTDTAMPMSASITYQAVSHDTSGLEYW